MVKPASPLRCAVNAKTGAAKASPASSAAAGPGSRSTTARRRRPPRRPRKTRAGQRARARSTMQQVADHDVADTDRGREQRVELPLPLDRRQHRPGGLPDRGLHRRRGDQAGRDERQVGTPSTSRPLPADQAAEPEPIATRNSSGCRNVVKIVPRHSRRQAAGSAPARAAAASPADGARTAARRDAGRGPRAGRATAQSTRVRPVRRRNTSSSVERRTSDGQRVEAARWTSAAASSPSSA